MGFAPGFASMGLLDPRIECARLDTRRLERCEPL
ncbi:MAG: carboxyltransferase domain-containing protein [Marinobacter psychrophilus]|nr:carboxyltransferase domain-containing protein [Marinobacter psychrophilus]MBQ0845442.1 carboxyltransferase domain-containing protein [Marinobacter psychrophilus]